MPDSTTPSTTPATPTTPRARGFFNKAQLGDVQLGEDILAAASDPLHVTALSEEEITTVVLDLFDSKLDLAREKIAISGQNLEDKKADTLLAVGTARKLVTALKGIQSAAKQRERLEAVDGDPATNFKATGYLIGKRLDISREKLVQNAVALIVKATAEPLPGHNAAKIAIIQAKLEAYQGSEHDQTDGIEESSDERIARDKIIADINNLRSAVQHAADRIYPYSEEENAPARATFKLPLDRVMAL